jgi:hypothetical protein
MKKVNYVLVSFSDGDARVYLKRLASKTTVRCWNQLKDSSKTTVRCWNQLKDRGETEDTAEIVAEGTDKERLITMAKLARHDYMMRFEVDYDAVADHTLVDRTSRMNLFP